MITCASFLYTAYLVCDETVPAVPAPDLSPTAFLTGECFHKLFLKSGGYGMELDTDGDPKYDASGGGRIHRAGAPAAICLSVPCPAHPAYKLGVEAPMALTLSPAVRDGDKWHCATDASVTYEITSYGTQGDAARATVRTRFPSGATVQTDYTVSARGVKLEMSGAGEIACLLPALLFDGETKTALTQAEGELTVSYGGFFCRYRTSGTVSTLDRLAANRNGHYKPFVTAARDRLSVEITIEES